MFHHLEDRNAFATEALRWLVPRPLFLVEEMALPKGYDKRKATVSLRIVRLGRGVTPDPRSNDWTWFDSDPEDHVGLHKWSASSKANHAGWPMRWGPTITKVTTKDRRLRHIRRDGIAEWRDYFERQKRTFTLETPWAEAPPGFQRAFTHHWSQLPGGTREGCEIGFFQGWDLRAMLATRCEIAKQANRCIADLVGDLDRLRRGESETVCPPVPTKGGHTIRDLPQFKADLDVDELARAIQFSDLAEQRVFAIHQPLTKSDARAVFERLAKQVAKALPDHRDLLGTPEAWTVFLAVETIQRAENVDVGEAIRRYIGRTKGLERLQSCAQMLTEAHVTPARLKRWFKKGLLLPPPEGRHDRVEWNRVRQVVNPILRKVASTYRTDIKARVEYLHALIGATFPCLDFEALTRLPSHKRKGR